MKSSGSERQGSSRRGGYAGVVILLAKGSLQRRKGYFAAATTGRDRLDPIPAAGPSPAAPNNSHAPSKMTPDKK